MATKANESIYFRDHQGEERFLFQVVNIGGNEEDDLKFTFNDKSMGTGVSYQESRGRLGQDDLVRMQPEISYHSDGSLLQKMVGESKSIPTVYRNPHGQGFRRTALNEVGFWEPFLEYKIVDYNLCMKSSASNPVVLPDNPHIFDGSPFECIFYLGDKSNGPLKYSQRVMSERREDIADSVDLLIVIRNTDFRGRHIQIGNSGNWVWSTNNVIDIIEGPGWEEQSGRSSRRFRMFLDESEGVYRSKNFELSDRQLQLVMQSMGYEAYVIQELFREGKVVDLQEVPGSPVTIRVERANSSKWLVNWTLEVGAQLQLPQALSKIVEKQSPAWEEE